MSSMFVTPGVLDEIAFTTFGVNAKPTPGAIGFFGTGLKYAIAVLLSKGYHVAIDTPRFSYSFHVEDTEFREKKFKRCYYFRQYRGQGSDPVADKFYLPFTTELGKSWGLAEAFRELYSNTLDEGGVWLSRLYSAHTASEESKVLMSEPCSHILIDHDNQDAVDSFEMQYKTMFLSSQPIETISGLIEVHRAYDTNALYYKGINVGKCHQPSLYTYNILQPLDLTEDRTVKHSWIASNVIRRYYTVHCKDMHRIMSVIMNPDTTEDKLNLLSYMSSDDASTTYIDAVKEIYRVRPGLFTGQQLREYYTLFGKPKRKKKMIDDTLKRKIREAHDICCRITPLFEDRLLDIIEVVDVEDLPEGTVARYLRNEEIIQLSEFAIYQGEAELVATLFEEYSHTLGYVDFDRDFQNFIFANFGRLASLHFGKKRRTRA